MERLPVGSARLGRFWTVFAAQFVESRQISDGLKSRAIPGFESQRALRKAAENRRENLRYCSNGSIGTAGGYLPV